MTIEINTVNVVMACAAIVTPVVVLAVLALTADHYYRKSTQHK